MKIGLDVTVLVEDNITGIGNYVNNYISSLLALDEKNNYSLLGITPLKAFSRISKLTFLNKKNANLKSYRLPSKLFHKVFGIWQALNWPPVEWLTGSIDIFHSFDWYCPPAKKAKIVATIFDTTPITHPEWHTKGNVAQHLVRLKAIKKNASHITTISECSKKDIAKHLNIDPGKITVAYPGIDTNKFIRIKDKNKIQRVLKKFALKPGFILFVGTIQPRKNVKGLIEAYHRLLSQEKDLPPLVLAGRRGKDSEKLPQGPNIYYLDYVTENELITLYNTAGVFVYPSLYEGFGMPVLEAMACGCPVITANVSSMPEVAGKAAILINPTNIKELSEAIKKVIFNISIYNKLQAMGWERVKRFTWKDCAKKTLEVYENLCMS